MENTLIICRNESMRRFYVDNLRIRNHPAAGIESMAVHPQLFWGRERPTLFILRDGQFQMEDNLRFLHHYYGLRIPVLVTGYETPTALWLVDWNIAAYFPNLCDGRLLMDILQPWFLPPIIFVKR